MPPDRRPQRWLFSCEHGGRSVPAAYAAVFHGAEAVLDSHRGWDRGALAVFDAFASGLGETAFSATTTRLLIDLNRSLHHRGVFSEFTRPLPREIREEIVARFWRPWREAVAGRIAGWLGAGDRVRHISVHSFVPVLDGVIRSADIGLLYDPARPAERDFCRRWQALLEERAWRVRLNYPYRGTADGHTTALRRRYPLGYAGMELEFNQALLPRRLAPLCADLTETLQVAGRDRP
jgi:predicted N-formylglutamate amidohydrolase